MSKKIRINKYIAEAGISSRRGADELILEGKVKVNGKVVLEPGMAVDEKDKVIVDGEPVKPRMKKYVIFNKPAGYITTNDDPQDRRTIYHILPEEMRHLKPAGRLDKDSSGLLILTNDGDLIQQLTHPKEHVSKVYRVMAQGRVSGGDVSKMANGIEIEKGKIAHAETIVLDYSKEISTLQIRLYQGYNRQIRKMLDALGHPVVSLKRIAHANLVVDGLKKGEYRFLKRSEVTALFNHLKKNAQG